MRQHLMRLDRIAGQMNGWLLLIAIGLGMLDLAVLIAKSVPAPPMPPAASSPALVSTPACSWRYLTV